MTIQEMIPVFRGLKLAFLTNRDAVPWIMVLSLMIKESA